MGADENMMPQKEIGFFQERYRRLCMSRKSYPSDLTETEWLLLLPLISEARSGGRPRSVAIREILNAIFYILRSGSGNSSDRFRE